MSQPFDTTIEAVTPSGVTPSVNATSVDAPTDLSGDALNGAGIKEFEIVESTAADSAAANAATDATDATSVTVPVSTQAAASVPVSTPAAIGMLCDFIPTIMMVNPMIESDDYYVVSKGRRVGIVTQPAVATALTSGIPGGSNKRFDTQQAAVDAFNALLAIPGVVAIRL